VDDDVDAGVLGPPALSASTTAATRHGGGP
jgi:hypothetical protein